MVDKWENNTVIIMYKLCIIIVNLIKVIIIIRYVYVDNIHIILIKHVLMIKI